ncbi:hypothetical protein BDV96DRAFT_581726 [Lophiotrema nucula]|uniref:WD40-repeat-containing domain protein n=1 Tax=Lophiotrema nucula TaxID=690887 RepID=A0A6A5Z046_9PLEO|nr:hypothetical protein BDV96DRAFT_581726 [Lophiotrema nucula]
MGKETTITRKWYDEKGKAKFAEGQKTKEISEGEGAVYLANGAPDEINFLMGAYADPLLYCLKQRRYLSTALPFIYKDDRRGWVLYLGTRLQETQWAPIEKGSTQYLAVAVEQKRMTGRQYKPMENPKAPAFTATKGFPASIQIWAFDPDEADRLDPKKEPRLELVLCTAWGAPKALRWCPIAPAETVTESTEGLTVHLGLLAGIWSDGKVRILEVSFQKSVAISKETKYIHYAKAAFEISFHNSVATCLHWLSGTSLIVGTALGVVAFWSLTRPDAFPPPNHSPDEVYKPPPRFYKRVSDTFIISIASGFPSRPNYVSLSSADGLGWLFDLRSPTLDVVNNPRGRMYSVTQSWHEHTQSFVSPDESFLLRCNSIRRYYTNIYCMRTESQILCCATSPVHPGTLLGTADGAVVAGNPIMRTLNYKEVPWQQTWFRHDWRRPASELPLPLWDPSQPPPAPPNEDSDEEDSIAGTPTRIPPSPPSRPSTPQPYTKTVPEEILANSLTRITEGFKAKPVRLQYSKPGKKRKLPHQGGKYLTVYEEPSAITCVAWNPNVQWGTWACAGMGDGLLRVEDIGV